MYKKKSKSSYYTTSTFERIFRRNRSLGNEENNNKEIADYLQENYKNLLIERRKHFCEYEDEFISDTNQDSNYLTQIKKSLDFGKKNLIR
jgi:hypothetical protein